MSTQEFAYNFPAIHGVQAGRIFYITMVPLRIVDKIFGHADDSDIPAELRAQRHINISRIPKIAQYITDNPTTYVLPSITASIGGEHTFKRLAELPGSPFGTLTIDMDSPILINDGQHRRAGIALAVKEAKAMQHEHISVVFYEDQGLKKSQQIFSDINQNAQKPTSSINHLFNHRDPINQVVNKILKDWPELSFRIEKEKGGTSGKTSKLFTLTAFRKANETLLNLKNKAWDDDETERRDQINELAEIALQFWKAAFKTVYGWQLSLNDMTIAYQLREESVTGHVVFLDALSRVGHTLMMEEHSKKTPSFKKLDCLKKMVHHRHDPLWEGRCVVLGRMQKTPDSIALTCNVLKKLMGYELTLDEQHKEDAASGKHNNMA